MPNWYSLTAQFYGDCERQRGMAEAWTDANKKRNLLQELLPMPSELEGTTSPGDDPNWYDWQRENWGVKWGTCGLKLIELDGDGMPLLLDIRVPWGSPNAKCMALLDKWVRQEFGATDVVWIGFDPCDDSVSVLDWVEEPAMSEAEDWL